MKIHENRETGDASWQRVESSSVPRHRKGSFLQMVGTSSQSYRTIKPQHRIGAAQFLEIAPIRTFLEPIGPSLFGGSVVVVCYPLNERSLTVFKAKRTFLEPSTDLSVAYSLEERKRRGYRKVIGG